MTMPHKPVEPTADRDQAAVDARDRLALIPVQMIAEVDHVANGDAADGERLAVGVAEPAGEFSQVIADRSLGVRREVVTCEVARRQIWLFRSHVDPGENIITPILHGLTPQIGQRLDRAGA